MAIWLLAGIKRSQEAGSKPKQQLYYTFQGGGGNQSSGTGQAGNNLDRVIASLKEWNKNPERSNWHAWTTQHQICGPVGPKFGINAQQLMNFIRALIKIWLKFLPCVSLFFSIFDNLWLDKVLKMTSCLTSQL